MMKCLSKIKSKTFYRRGTSLLEVLVATGVITTGMAVTIPAVGTIRESSQSLTCKDHLRTLGQAHLSYSLDHMNRFAGNFTLKSQPSWVQNSWVQILNHEYFGDDFVGGDSSSYSFTRANSGTIRWVANRLTTQPKHQIWCPSVRNLSHDSFRCYPMNRYAGIPGSQDELEIISSRDNHPKYKYYILGVKTSKYKNPANSVLHHEAISTNDWITAGSGQPLLLIEGIQDEYPGAANEYGVISAGTGSLLWHFRHNLRMNMLYMDGRVGTETFGTEGLNTAERYHYDN